MRAVRFDKYGAIDQLYIAEIPDPQAAPGRVVVRVRAASINPGELTVLSGAYETMTHHRTTFPSGEGSDFAGEVAAVGESVEGVAVGDQVLGWSDERGTHAELVSVPAEQVIPKPEGLSWDVAGSLYVAPMAGLASVQSVEPREGDVVVVSAAAGGVGLAAAQLAKHAGATVIGLAGQDNHEWLRSRGIIPVLYGEGQEERVREAAGGKPISAFIDTFGSGYVDLALALGVPRERINTVIDFKAVQEKGVKAMGTGQAGGAPSLRELADLASSGVLDIPIAAVYPLDQVREAYQVLSARHTRGKIVLHP